MLLMIRCGPAACVIFPVGVELSRAGLFGQEHSRGVDPAKIETEVPRPLVRNRKPLDLVEGLVKAVVDHASRPSESRVIEHIPFPMGHALSGSLILLARKGGAADRPEAAN